MFQKTNLRKFSSSKIWRYTVLISLSLYVQSPILPRLHFSIWTDMHNLSRMYTLGSVFSLMAAEDRERLRRTAELAKQGILPLPASVQPHPPAPQPRPAHSQDQSLKPGALLSELPHHSTSSSNSSSSKFTLESEC